MSAPLVRREFRARPGRLLLVFVTVVVAVAFTSGAFGFSEQLTRLLQPADDVQDALALPEGTVIVTGRTDGLSAATALDDSLLDKVRAIDGVASAQGSYDQPVAFDVPWGVDWSRPGLIRGLVITSNYDPANWSIVEGRAPIGRSEVAVDANGAVVGAVSLGSNARLQLPIGTVDVEVVGIMAPAASRRGTGLERFDRPRTGGDATDGGASDGGAGTGESAEGGSIGLASAHVVLDPAAAPEMLGAVGRVDRITVTPTPGVTPDQLQARLERGLPDGVNFDAITSPAAATQQTVSSIEDGVRLATYVYAGVTLLVSVLVVINVLSVIVAQRTRELGLLRAVGAKRSTLVRMVLGESVIIGLAAAVVGGALGVLLAWAGAKAIEIGGLDVAFLITPAMIIVAVAVGVLVTTLGGLWPALRAGRVTPLDALSDTRAGADRRTRAPLPVALALGGFGLAAWTASRTSEITADTGGPDGSRGRRRVLRPLDAVPVDRHPARRCASRRDRAIQHHRPTRSRERPSPTVADGGGRLDPDGRPGPGRRGLDGRRVGPSDDRPAGARLRQRRPVHGAQRVRPGVAGGGRELPPVRPRVHQGGRRDDRGRRLGPGSERDRHAGGRVRPRHRRPGDEPRRHVGELRPTTPGRGRGRDALGAHRDDPRGEGGVRGDASFDVGRGSPVARRRAVHQHGDVRWGDRRPHRGGVGPVPTARSNWRESTCARASTPAPSRERSVS